MRGWMGPAGRALLALSSLALAGIGAMLALTPPGWSIGPLVGDDAGYYLGIARNFCLGYGYSFDRLHATNGFNPLLLWLLIPLNGLLPRGLPLEACYRLGVMVGFAAVVLALLPYRRVLDAFLDRGEFTPESRRFLRGAGVAFFALFIATKRHYGMDPPLVLLIGLWYLARVVRRGLLPAGAGTAVVDGCLLGLLFLARVDSLPLLVAAWALMGLEALACRGAWRRLLARLAATAAICAPYLIWSTTRFGTWLPVSARIKSSFPELDLAQSLWTIRHTSTNPLDQVSFLAAYLLAWGTIAALAPRFAAALRARTQLEPWNAALGLLALYLVGRLTYMLLFSRADVQGGYVVLAHVFNVLVLVAALGALTRSRRAQGPAFERRLAALAGTAVGLVAFLAFAGKLQATLSRRSERSGRGAPDEARLGRDIREHTRPGDVLFGGSFGLPGFFSDRAWINGDGVVNTYEYQRVFLSLGARGEGGLQDYMRANRVTHVAFVLAPGARPQGAAPIPLTEYSWLHDRSNWFEVSPRDIVLERPSARGPAGSGTFCLARWPP